MHILVENRKWVVWEAKHRFCIFRINIKGFATWFSTLCENFESKFEKITRTKQKDRRLFLCPLYALFPMECSLPKVLQKCFLTQIKTLDSLWNYTNCIKLWEKQQGIAWKAKHKPCFFRLIIPSWLSKIM